VEKQTILVVDDTPENIDVLVGVLKNDYKVKAASNGEKALKVVEKSPPDLILLDVMMPVMDGYETCRRLKEDEKYKEIPIIFLTAKTETEDIVKGFDMGAVDYVTKPFNPVELLARVNTHLTIRQQKIQLAETDKIRSMTLVFEKFVPYQFLSRIASQGIEKLVLGKGERGFFTVMFSDIRSFTTYSENMEPEDLFSFLNEYLKIMNHQIHENYGFIDKFIGDAIMALFDHPDKSKHSEAHYAVMAAIGMQSELERFNHDRIKQGHAAIKSGIGIHSGQAMVGTIGSEKRMDFTVLGDNVNLSSRIEGLTKLYGVNIMISDSTLRLLKNLDHFRHRELDWVKVKGKSKPVELYEIYNNDPPEIQELKRKAGSSILRGLTQRRRKAWDKAIAAFEKALSIYPDDQAAKLHIERCHQLRQMDLPDDWDGSIDLDHK
jgi:two-component system sensor histidine kinase ChiS